MSLLILVADDEPDVETLFRQHFRRDLRDGRFTMEFAQSAPAALQHITDAGAQSLILVGCKANAHHEMSGGLFLPEPLRDFQSKHAIAPAHRRNRSRT
jgi:CheY-like chemotaxis protein